MSAHVDVVNAFFTAIDAKDVDAALAFFTEDAAVQGPMGTSKGHAKIRGMLGMMTKMPAAVARPTPVEEGGVVLARVKSPMGPMTMVFEFEGDLICRQSMKPGG